MQHADDFNCLGLTPDVFQRHGNTEKDKIGEGLNNTDDAKTAKGGAKHEIVIVADDGNDKNLVFGFLPRKFKLPACSAECWNVF